MENDIFGIILSGSRVKGYNKKGSDIDIALIQPQDAWSSPETNNQIFRVINETLKKRGLPEIDTGVGMWTEFPIPTDPKKFLYFIDHKHNELITLFGYMPYQNPNVRIAQLAVVELIGMMHGGKEVWERLQDAYSWTHLGVGHEQDRIIVKLASRLRLKSREVEAILTQSLFEERKKKFSIQDRETLEQSLKGWYVKNKGKLKTYRMVQVYEEVKKLIAQGF